MCMQASEVDAGLIERREGEACIGMSVCRGTWSQISELMEKTTVGLGALKT